MKQAVETKCCQIVKYADEETRRQLIILEAPVYLWLVIPWLIYVVGNVLVSSIDVGDLSGVLSLGASLLLYILLLISLSIGHTLIKARLIKKSAETALIPPEKLSNSFAITLLVVSLDFFVIGGIDGFWHNDWTVTEVALLTLSLYVGFAVSLDEVFSEGKSLKIWYELTKPFRQMKISVTTVILVIAFVIIMALISTWKHALLALIALNLLLLAVMELLLRIRNKRLLLWGKNIATVLQNKKVLIYQLGTDSVVKHELEESLENMGVEIVDIDADACASSQFDIALILNSLINCKNVLSDIECLNSVLNDEGCIIDPFITKRKHRSILCAGSGLPNAAISGFSLNDYLTVIKS